jgi:hypothetical protein
VAVAEWVLTGGLLAGIGYVFLRSVVSGGRRGRLRLLALRRAPRARRTAEQAALDDPVFAPERIEATVVDMVPDVLGRDAHLTGRVRVDILGLINRAGDSEDRVVVRVRARSRRGGAIDERWTLVRDGDAWRLGAVAGDPLARSLLQASLIASPKDDTKRLREQSLQELSDAGAPSPGELVDSDAPALQQLRDLAVADERFDPLLIEAALEHIVQAWEQSSDGSDAPLLAVATGAGAHGLQFPAPGNGRRRIRDGRLQQREIVRVNAAATPPQVDVRVRVRAAVSDEPHPRRLTLAWTLALDETTHGQPRWRLTDSADAT